MAATAAILKIHDGTISIFFGLSLAIGVPNVTLLSQNAQLFRLYAPLQYLHLCTGEDLLSRCLWIVHTSLELHALIRSWQGVYVCKFRSTRTRFQFKKTLPGEHSPENFCCVGPHFQACMNLADVFCL